jgi:hypothetical protein
VPGPTEETEAARRLFEYLGGHPLALTQASSLAWRRKWPAKKLLENYEKFPRVVHQKLDPALLHAGYALSMSTMFLVSFESLTQCNWLSPTWASVTLGQPPRKHGLANPWMKAFPLPHRTFQQHARTSTLAG